MSTQTLPARHFPTRTCVSCRTERQKRDPIVWAGPVLASDRLIVTGSHGEALAISPYTGEVLGRFVIGARVFISPIVANGIIYFLDDTGRVLALR